MVWWQILYGKILKTQDEIFSGTILGAEWRQRYRRKPLLCSFSCRLRFIFESSPFSCGFRFLLFLFCSVKRAGRRVGPFFVLKLLAVTCYEFSHCFPHAVLAAIADMRLSLKSSLPIVVVFADVVLNLFDECWVGFAPLRVLGFCCRDLLFIGPEVLVCRFSSFIVVCRRLSSSVSGFWVPRCCYWLFVCFSACWSWFLFAMMT